MIINNLNALANCFAALQCCALVSSKADFSRRYLEKGPSYLSSMQARIRHVPDLVMAVLEWSLQRELVSYARNPHLGSQHAVRLNSAHSCMVQQLQFLRRHRASMAAFAVQPPANDSHPTDAPPRHGCKERLYEVAEFTEGRRQNSRPHHQKALNGKTSFK